MMPVALLQQLLGQAPAAELSGMSQLLFAVAALVFAVAQTFFKVLEWKEKKKGNGNGNGSNHAVEARILELADQVLSLATQVAGQVSYSVRDHEDIQTLRERVDVMGGSLREEVASMLAKQELILERYDRRIEKITERVDGLAA